MRVSAAAALVVGLVAGSAALVDAQPVAAERVVYLMGTRVTLVAEANTGRMARERLDSLLRSLEQTEAELSTWRDSSVLSRASRHPLGDPFQLPDSVCRLWSGLVMWHDATDGAFDPAIGAWRDAWGLREEGRVPTEDEWSSAAGRSGLEYLRFDEPACTLVRTREVTLDAGAFGKGAALARLPRAEGGESWLVDLGGQVAVSGRAHTVALAHPVHRTQVVAEVALESGSLATSGDSERSWDVGTRVTHLLDPRTGRPVPRAASVTVWHPDPLAADILSTALYVLGPEEGLRLAEERALAVLFLTVGPDGETEIRRPSAAFTSRFGLTRSP